MIVETIIQQMGGRRLQMMTGCKFYKTDEHTLTIVLKRNKRFMVSYNHGTDLYRVTYVSVNAKTLETELLAKHEGVYAEDLIELFEKETNLYAHP